VRCHLSSPLTVARGAQLPRIWDPVATAPPECPRCGAAGPLSHPAPFLVQSWELRMPQRVAASQLCLRYLRDRFGRMPTAALGCARMRRPAAVGFGSRVVSRESFSRLPSTSCLHLCTHHPSSIPQCNPASSPPARHPPPPSLIAYVKTHQPPNKQGPRFPGCSPKAGVLPFFCACTRVPVSLASSLPLMGPWSLFYTKATQVDVFLNGLILSPCLMICRVIY